MTNLFIPLILFSIILKNTNFLRIPQNKAKYGSLYYNLKGIFPYAATNIILTLKNQFLIILLVAIYNNQGGQAILIILFSIGVFLK